MVSFYHFHEADLYNYAQQKLNAIDGLTFYVQAKNRDSVISFLIDGVHMLDAGMILDKMGIAVRTGTHCAQPIMQRYNIDGTVRVSMALYNTKAEIDYLCKAIEQVKTMFL